MLDRIESLRSGAKSVEVLVPNQMTFHGRRIGRTFSQAVVLNRLLQKDLAPTGSERQDNGQLLTLGRPKPLDPSTLRTAPPPIDITERVPALAPLAKTTTRLHPRRATD